MDYATAAFLIAIIIGSVAGYAIMRVSNGATRDRELRHKEFTAQLEPLHLERMATIGANRDAEIAKATRKDPMPASRQIEG